MAAFILGCIGYRQLFLEQSVHPSITDIIYGSLSLFLFTPPPGTRLPVAPDVARFAAPIAIDWASVTAVASLFKEGTNRLRAWQHKDHVIVCGLGFKGAAFIETLRAAGYSVIAIERDGTNPAIARYRKTGVPVIVGDAQHEETLSQAGVERAQWLLALCPDDAINAEIVLTAHVLVQDKKFGALNCLAQISGPQLCQLLSK